MPNKPREKLPFFIETYPDELWCGVIARLHQRLAYSWTATCRLVYDSTRGPGSFGLPTGFERFVALIPEDKNISPDQLIEDHTLLPLYSPFLAHEQLGTWKSRMLRPGNIITFHEPHEENGILKFCKQCVEDDTGSSMPPYWRRSHNSPRVNVCAKHECFLHASPLEANGFVSPIPGATKSIQLGTSRKEKSFKIHLAYARSCAFLLDRQSEHVTFEVLRARYLHALETEGCTNQKSIVSELSKRVAKAVSFSALYDPVVDKPEIWVRCALYPQRLRHGRPFQHFVTSEALGSNLVEMLSTKKSDSMETFGLSPKPISSIHAMRDALFCKQIYILAKARQQADEKPKRRTRVWYLRQLRLPHDVEKGRLPKTLSTLEEIEESLSQYNRRWLKWMAWNAPLNDVSRFETKSMVRNHLVRGGTRLEDDIIALLDQAWDALCERRIKTAHPGAPF